MKQITLLFLFTLNFCFAQSSETERLIRFGDNASSGNDFETAKKLYSKAVELDSVNKDALYKLGVAELNLKENRNACEHLYKSFTLKNQIVADYIIKYCQEFPEYLVYPISVVDEKPKFIYNGETYPLFKDKDLSKKFKDLLSKEMRNSDVLFKNARGKGKIYSRFHVDEKGKFNGDVVRIETTDEQSREKVKEEILIIFEKFNYLPAIHKGKTVMISEIFMLPLDFGN